MRPRSWKYIVTFNTTTAAMAFESVCNEREIPGRLIPVPKEITTGCGLAWCAQYSDAEVIEALLKEGKLEYDRAEKLWH